MSDSGSLQLRFDNFELDEAQARLLRDGRAVTLPPKAFSVLCALARQPGRLITKDALLDEVWGHRHVSESVLKTTISELRAALTDDAKRPRYIETASRRGYRFIAVPNSPPGTAPAVSALPLVETPTSAVRPAPMVGRRAALSRLQAAWGNAAAGRRQIVWVAGEAGIGKTTLLDHFVSGLETVVYARGQCVEQHGAGEPYLPVLEALAVLARDDAELPSLLRTVAPTWFLQLPWLGSADERANLRRELAGVGQDRMLREFGELLDQYTQRRPLLLVTEDLHWSDHATVRLIDHVARRRGSARLMWLASFRLVEVIAEDHPLKALRHELRLHRLCDEIALDPFSESELGDYLGRRFPGSEMPEHFVRALHERTDGLPLFVVNVIDDLAAQGDLRAAAFGASPQVPESLAGVIEKQVARLSPDERTFLKAASVCGVEFRPAIVAEAVQRDAPWALELCDELARRGHWLGNPVVDRQADGALDVRYTFRHALYRHVLYQRIGTLARSALHGRVARALEHRRALGLMVAAAELAVHYEASHELMPALRCYAEAAESALRHFAPKEALELAAHALSLLPQVPAGPQRDGIELTLNAMRGVASAQARGVSAPETKAVFERARELLAGFPDHPMAPLVLHALGLVFMVRAEYAESCALGEQLLALAEARNNPIVYLSGCNLLGQSAALQGRYADSVEWLQRGIEGHKKIGDEALQTAFMVDPAVTMYGAAAVSLLLVGRVNDARASAATAQERARRLGQPMSQVVANWFNALLEVRMGNVERVGEIADNLRAIVDKSAIAQGEAPSLWYRGWAEAHRGDPRAGYERILAAYRHNTGLGMYSGAAEVLAYGVEALILAQDWREAAAQLDQAMQLAERLGERAYRTQMLLLKARIATGQGDSEAARAAIQAALHEARDQGSVWLEIMVLVVLCEFENATADDFDALNTAYERLQEGRDTAVAKHAHGLIKKAQDLNPVIQ